MHPNEYPGKARSMCLPAAVRAMGAVAVLVLGVAAAGGQPDQDPLPLVRIELTPEQIARELARTKQDALVKLSRADFEARVRKAAAVRTAKTTAHVVRAHYIAELAEQDLVQGRGEWAVVNPSAGSALLPLASLSVALSNCAWEDGAKAVLGDLEGKGLAAWVPSAALSSLFFDWTCRGSATPQGVSFDLRLPSAPQTTVELKLPADCWPAVPAKTGLLTGPHEAGVAGKRLWKLQLAGKTQVQLTVRKVAAGPVPLFVQTQSRQFIMPDRVLADYEYQVEVPRGAIRELLLDGTGALEPIEVTARAAELDWRWEAAGRDKGTLIIAFREPQSGLIAGLRVRCVAPRPAAPAEWTSPALRVRQGLERSETLKLTIHPDVDLQRWAAGDFRLTGVTPEADGGQTLSLVNLLAAAGPLGNRPRGQLMTGGADFVTVQESHWQIEPDATVLRSEIAYQVTRGALHQLVLKLPAAGGPFEVESVETRPKTLLRGHAVIGPLLFVDLDRGITPRSDARLLVRLRSSLRSTPEPRVLDLPDLVPQNPQAAGARQSKLAIALDPTVSAQLLQSSVAPTRLDPLAPTRDRPAPAFTFAYHDQPLTGKLRLFAQRPVLHARTTQDVIIGADGGAWRAKVAVEPVVGRPNALDIYLSAPVVPGWQAQVDGEAIPIQGRERLLLQEALPHLLALGATAPVQQTALQLGMPRGERWRIRFAAPLTQKTTLELRGALQAAGRGKQQADWDVAVLSVPGADEREGDLHVHVAGQRIARVAVSGMTGKETQQSSENRDFQVDPAARALPRLWLRTTPGAATLDENAICETSELTTRLERDGSLTHLLRVRLRNWRQPRFDLAIPGTAQALAARVDGVWLDRLDAREQPAATRLSLPVNATAPIQLVELLFATPASVDDWGLVRIVHTPEPELPKRPLAQQRFWRLPPDWVPCSAGRWQPRGTPASIRQQQSLSALPERLWQAGASLVPAWDQSSRVWLEAQRADLLKAESEVRPQLVRGATLGTALDQLARRLRKTTLVAVDREGLRAATIHAGTVLPLVPADKPFWEALDLVFLLSPGGPLLTTPQRVRGWQQQVGNDTPLGVVLDLSVAEAIRFGHDHAGCLVAVETWLRRADRSDTPTSSVAPAFSWFGDRVDNGWTEWEAVPGLPADHDPLLLHVPPSRWVGYGFAALWLLGAAWLGWRHSAAFTFRVHVIGTGLLLLAVLWLPALARDLLALPALVIELVLFTLLLTAWAWPLRNAPRTSKSTMVRITAVMLMGTGAAGVPLLAQSGAEAHPVYIVAGAEPGQQFAYVGVDLLRKLDNLANQPRALPVDAVIVAARYQGDVREGMAEIAAAYDLHQFSEHSTLVIPLTGVQLQPGVFLDGAPVFPVAHKGGYALPVRGKGWHQLTLRFQNRAVLANDQYEVRFGIPRAGQCVLELSATAPTLGLHFLTGLGETRVSTDKKGGSTLKAQVGHEGIIHLRWQASTAGTTSVVDVREAYSWDLRATSLGLTAGVQFVVTKGSLPQARFALPDGLEIRQVEVASRPGAPALQPTPTLRDWEVVGKDGARQLVIRFAQPVTGSVTLVIEMVPRLALTPGSWTLRLPTPLLGTSTAGLLAYRLDGMDAVSSPQGLSIGTVVTPDLLAESWVKAALREPTAATKVVNFRRVAPSAALGLTVPPARPTAQIDARWQVGPRSAALTAQVDVTSAAEELALVELELPVRFKLIRIAQSGGAPVQRWTRQDRHVQVWLPQAHKQIRLEVAGWIDHVKPGPVGLVDLGSLSVLNARAQSSSITLHPEPGLTLTPQRLVRLRSGAKSDALRFTSESADYEASFALGPVPVPAVGRALTMVERRGATIDMTTVLHLQLKPGPLEVRVSGSAGWDLRLDTPAPIVRTSHQQIGAQQRWMLEVPPGLPQQITLTLRARQPVARAEGGCTLPRFDLGPGTLKDHWIALSDVEPATKDAIAWGPFTATAQGPLGPPPLPATLRPGARLGKLTTVDGVVALRVPPNAATNTTQIVGAEQSTRWSGTEWLHQLHILALSHGRGEVRIHLPEGALCRGVAVDQVVSVPRERDLVIPLPGAAGPRNVVVAWSYGDDESPTAPRVKRPLVEGLAESDGQMRFWLPAAYRLAHPPGGLAENAVNAILQRAAMRMRLCSAWAELVPPAAELRREQQAFHRDVDEATALIAHLERSGTTAATAPLQARADALVRENERLAREGRYEAKPAPTWAPRARHAPLVVEEVGMPLSWPWSGTLALKSMIHEQDAIATAASELLLLLVIALLLLSLTRGVTLIHALWPEILLLCAVAGTWLGGLSLVAIGLALVGAVLRGVWLVVLTQRLLPGWFVRPEATPNGDAASTPPA